MCVVGKVEQKEDNYECKKKGMVREERLKEME